MEWNVQGQTGMSSTGARQDAPAASEVVAALARVLASSGFARAPSLSRLLSHVVELRLRGDTCSLKEYALGVEVFGRGADFDPCTDTIVRVHARRLRSRLDAYYAGDGRDDPIRIDVPKGHYEPAFRRLSTHAPMRPPTASAAAAPISMPIVDAMHADSAPARAPARAAVHLPAPRTALVGRAGELAQLLELLACDSVRLLTLTGAGGSGKTRLALQAAREGAVGFPGGVRFIDLAPVGDAGTVVAVLARELGVRHSGGRPLEEAVIEHLRGNVDAATLLLLDNVEHLPAAVPFFGALLDACAPLKLLATSRVPLHLYGEHEFAVAPLALPDLHKLPEGHALALVPAVALFLHRAAAVNAPLSLEGGNGRAIAELLCRLDGLPLAIELVAPHARTLSPAQMLERFSAGLSLPDNPATDVPERQRTLRQTIAWSHALLTAREQVLLRRLSVFAGGFSLEAAGAVADANQDLGFDIAAGVASLRDKSLLHVSMDAGGPRFGMLDSIRLYGREQLALAGEQDLYLRALAAYCLVLAEEGASASGREHEDWLQRCADEHDNFRVALDALVEAGAADWALRMGQALFSYWERSEHLGEGRQRLQSVLAIAGSDTDVLLQVRVRNYLATLEALQGDFASSDCNSGLALAQARAAGDALSQAASLNALASNAIFQERFDAADEHLAECVALCRQLAHPGQLAGALSNRAKCRLAQGDPEQAVALLGEAQALFRACGNAAGLAWCDNHLGDVAAACGDASAAARLYRQALAAFTELADGWGVARSLTDLGHLVLREGAVDEAGALFVQALGIFNALEHKRGVSRLLEGCACVAASAGDSERALVLAGAAEAVRRSTGMVARPADQLLLDATLAPARERHPADTCRALRERGLAMSYERAIQFALQPAARTHAVEAMERRAAPRALARVSSRSPD